MAQSKRAKLIPRAMDTFAGLGAESEEALLQKIGAGLRNLPEDDWQAFWHYFYKIEEYLFDEEIINKEQLKADPKANSDLMLALSDFVLEGIVRKAFYLLGPEQEQDESPRPEVDFGNVEAGDGGGPG